MKTSTLAAAVLALALAVLAHPERHHDHRGLSAKEKRAAAMALVGRTTDKCAAALEARKAATLAKRAHRLRVRRQEAAGDDGAGRASRMHRRNELQYTTIQNSTCVLAPDTIWGPYGIDGEMVRHDLREQAGGVQQGLDFYLDIGVIDVETCDPLPQARLSIWNCNATGSYAGYTGIDPNTVSLLDGWSTRSDGTTDDETFLRGIQTTDAEGMVEFLTLFPGYYASRTTHVHLTVQTNTSANGSASFAASPVQHIGQLFFDEDLLAAVYALAPYHAHLATLNRTTNAEDSLLGSASADGFSPFISVEQLGDSLADGLVGYITVGVNKSAAGLETTGSNVNVLGTIPTVTVGSSKLAQATAVDRADGYTS